jgi:peroxiredoxin
MTRRDLLVGSVSLLAMRQICAARLEHPDGSELLGRPAPPLNLSHWLNSPPLEIGKADLRGKVVLLRWWTQGCPLCEATAPALLALRRKYESEGLRIIGIYHPKPKPGDWNLSKVKADAEQKHFTFPIAVDGDWSALKRWWLFQERDFTSVSFLIDRRGIIRYVHPGGEFHEGNQGAFDTHESCQRDYHVIEDTIRRLLTELA